ncbi:MAG: AbrB/MazE/SpoVT family DNA-binding domain-containing protein [Candidatus Woesearchaeota archaeon]|jgi:bifunctional DNA-binding transcriptional regulator/antitoxin component of YhaV-PrlF toxin-antitoxin module|nr:AbrB/MazE/SpoVT family DNA-binding domain-containing protein [Candidatus Woesearchaeota archaeon]|tara:strand:- start:436 stop:615 length:180 start_codon:yes stop_codon:yes gene_type:complete
MQRVKVQQMSKEHGSYFITLPKQILNAKGWNKGDYLNVEIDSKGNLVLKKALHDPAIEL